MAEHSKRYDVIIIGTGQSGKPLASAFAGAGKKTAVIEQKYVGGSCINYGCTPTKTMIASARIAHLARRGGDYGVSIPSLSVNLSKVIERKDEIVRSFRESGEKGLQQTENLDLIFGTAGFFGKNKIEVRRENENKLFLEAETIVINTGARPRIPDIAGLNTTGYHDSTSIMQLDKLPDHLLVLGGGYIGLEFGQMFRRFGSEVTIIQRGNQLLSREDEDVAQEISNILREEGISIFLDSEVTQVESSRAAHGIKLSFRSDNRLQDIEGSHVLIATGRIPNTDDLHLDQAGIETDKRGHIKVNHKLETNVPGIYAIGDVKGGPAFTHISYDDFRVLRANLIDKANATTEGRLVPYTVFTDPQLGRVGLSEQEAKASNKNFRVAKLPMNYVARAIEAGETRGFMKVVVDADSHHILGCAILGIEGGEIMALLQMAMMGNVTFEKIRDGIFAHPTLAESLNNLFMSFEN